MRGELEPWVPIVAVDVAVFTVLDNELKVLLVEMTKDPYRGRWALPGGIIAAGESLDDAARRELAEQTGVRDVYLEQLYTFGEVDRDKTRRAISTVYFALVNAAGLSIRTSPKYAGIDWFGVGQLPPLAYDHTQVIRYAVQRLRWKLEYTNVAWSLLPAEFTLTELQNVYETILGRRLDKRNFRKKILSTKLLKATSHMRRQVAHRPAALYRFARREPMIVEIL